MTPSAEAPGYFHNVPTGRRKGWRRLSGEPVRVPYSMSREIRIILVKLDCALGARSIVLFVERVEKSHERIDIAQVNEHLFHLFVRRPNSALPSQSGQPDFVGQGLLERCEPAAVRIGVREGQIPKGWGLEGGDHPAKERLGVFARPSER